MKDEGAVRFLFSIGRAVIYSRGFTYPSLDCSRGFLGANRGLLFQARDFSHWIHHRHLLLRGEHAPAIHQRRVRSCADDFSDRFTRYEHRSRWRGGASLAIRRGGYLRGVVSLVRGGFAGSRDYRSGNL